MYRTLFVGVVFFFSLLINGSEGWNYSNAPIKLLYNDVKRKSLDGNHAVQNFILKSGLSKKTWFNLNEEKVSDLDRSILGIQDGKVLCTKSHAIMEVMVIREELISDREEIRISNLTLMAFNKDGVKEYLGTYPLTLMNFENTHVFPKINFTNFKGYITCVEKDTPPYLIPKYFEKETFIHGPWIVPVKITIKKNPLLPFSIAPIITILGNKSVLDNQNFTFVWPYAMETFYDAYLMILGEDAFRKGINCFLSKESRYAKVKLHCNNWNKKGFLNKFNQMMIPAGLMIAFMNALFWNMPELIRVQYQSILMHKPSRSDRFHKSDYSNNQSDTSELIEVKKIIDTPSDAIKGLPIQDYETYEYARQGRNGLALGTVGTWLTLFAGVNGITGIIYAAKLRALSKELTKRIQNAPFFLPWRMEKL